MRSKGGIRSRTSSSKDGHCRPKEKRTKGVTLKMISLDVLEKKRGIGNPWEKGKKRAKTCFIHEH